MSIFSHFKLHYWPGLTFGIFVFTFLVSYLMSVLGGHTYGFFPYISDTGSVIPESCVFGQLVNFAALSLGITLYIRYRQVDISITNGDFSDVRKFNRLSWYLAILFAVGTSVVANFQETAILPVHMFGAMVAFGAGSFYFVVQTRISYGSRYIRSNQSRDFTISKNVYTLRFFLSVWLFPLFIIVGVSGTTALIKFTGKTIIWWTEKEGGYTAHLISTFCEWILVILMLVYILTFTHEFRTISFSEVGFVSRKVNPKIEPIINDS